jgi:hypothetical protein
MHRCTMYVHTNICTSVYIEDVGNACASGVKCVEPSQYIYSASVGGPWCAGALLCTDKTPH